MTRFVGIDPGATGAIGWLQGDSAFVAVYDMPPNPRDLFELLQGTNALPSRVILEQAQAMPRQGVSSTFKYGVGYGVILGVLASLGISYELVSPAKWKRAMGLDSDKERVRAVARQRWPTAPLSRVKDHGRAEALLLAEYLRRRENGGSA